MKKYICLLLVVMLFAMPLVACTTDQTPSNNGTTNTDPNNNSTGGTGGTNPPQ